jgi:hypothetical protein
VDRPVCTPLAELASAVERIDDPYARLRQPLGRIRAFFGQQAVVWPLGGEMPDEIAVRQLVARFAQRLPFEPAVGA